jgi:hypothetical protein
VKRFFFLLNAAFAMAILDLIYNVEEYGRARQATDDNIIWRMRLRAG